jgi:glucose/arabinose dehydrogenase
MRYLAALATVVAFTLQAGGTRPLPVDTLKVPAGFHVAVYATGIPAARELAIGPKGTVFVGSMRDSVYAVVDLNGDQRADKAYRIGSGMKMPSGIAFHNGALYVADIDRVLRYDDIEAHLENPPQPVVVSNAFPDDTAHGWKFIAFGPDGLLYVPVGAPCNICEPDARHGGIFRMKADGSGLENFATGVRNSVGFDWHPVTKDLWFTTNGRDELGDDLPSDELNHAPRKGMNFGYPYCHQGDTPDPEFGAKHPCSAFEPPAAKLGAHVASLGMRFYTGRMFPPEYRNQIFIAEHGSWNRSTPQGYRVVSVKLDANGKVVSDTPFVEGWLRGIRRHTGTMTVGDAWGRPADVLVMPDGALLISDDSAGAIYRVSYRAR